MIFGAPRARPDPPDFRSIGNCFSFHSPTERNNWGNEQYNRQTKKTKTDKNWRKHVIAFKKQTEDRCDPCQTNAADFFLLGWSGVARVSFWKEQLNHRTAATASSPGPPATATHFTFYYWREWKSACHGKKLSCPVQHGDEYLFDLLNYYYTSFWFEIVWRMIVGYSLLHGRTCIEIEDWARVWF